MVNKLLCKPTFCFEQIKLSVLSVHLNKPNFHRLLIILSSTLRLNFNKIWGGWGVINFYL